MRQPIPGAAYLQSQGYAVETNEDMTIDNEDALVDVTGPGVTLKLPPNPRPAQSHRILASGGFSVAIDSNGHPIADGGSMLLPNFSIDLSFSVASGVWVAGGATLT